MARFYTSDLHFGHQRIIDLSYRPFATLDQMHTALVDRWNAVVGDDDEVWVLGDLMLGPIGDLPERYLSQLKGVKVLVPGNHDQCWLGHGNPRSRSSRKHLYQVLAGGGFDRVEDHPTPHLIAGEEVGLCHFPYDGDHTADVRYPEWRPEDNGGWLLHGHVHDLWQQNGRQINVGCDVWDYTPVSEAEIAGIILASSPSEADGRHRIAQMRVVADLGGKKLCGTCGRVSANKGQGLVLCRRCSSYYYSWPPYDSIPDPEIMDMMPWPLSRRVEIITRRGVLPELSSEENRSRWVHMAAAV